MTKKYYLFSFATIIVGIVLAYSLPALAFDDSGSVTICNSCGDCSDAIMNSADDTIWLENDIVYSGTAIDSCIDVQDVSNKTFDCRQHSIRRSTGAFAAIKFTESDNFTIQNCEIFDFDRGIQIGLPGVGNHYSNTYLIDNNTVTDCLSGITLEESGSAIVKDNHLANSTLGMFNVENSEIYNNTILGGAFPNHVFGIRLSGDSKNNHIHDNLVEHNSEGGVVFGDKSIANNLSNNRICDNLIDVTDDSSSSSPNFGDLNTGDTVLGNTLWYDDGESGAKHFTRDCVFTGECTCATCDECEAKINDDNCTTITLTADIMDYSDGNGTCIDSPEKISSKTFDCDGHIIDGLLNNSSVGIKTIEKSDFTIKNCFITDFVAGLELEDNSGDGVSYTIENNRISNCQEGGIIINTTQDATITSNQIYNNNRGIVMRNVRESIIHDNYIHDNSGSGILFYTHIVNTPSMFYEDTHTNVLTGNIIEDNGMGIYFDNVSKEPYGNEVHQNQICRNGVDIRNDNDGLTFNQNFGDSNTGDTADGSGGWLDLGVLPPGPPYFTAACSSGSGALTVDLTTINPPPTTTPVPIFIQDGSNSTNASVELKWTIGDVADSCVASTTSGDNWTGNKEVTGGAEPVLITSVGVRTYTLTCTSPGNPPVSASIDVDARCVAREATTGCSNVCGGGVQDRTVQQSDCSIVEFLGESCDNGPCESKGWTER